MLVGPSLARGGLAVAAALLLATSTPAQYGLPGSESGGSEEIAESTPVYYGEEVTGDTVLADGYSKNFKMIDNTFFGGPSYGAMKDYFEDRGWESDYDEDSFKAGFLEELEDVDVLYIVSHAGVSESTGEVGLAWRNLFGLNETVVLASEIREALADGSGPKLVVISGCMTAHNQTMAAAFPNAAFVGFADKVPPTAAYPFASAFLKKIADGKSIQEAWNETPKPPHTLGSPTGGDPRLILPGDLEQVD